VHSVAASAATLAVSPIIRWAGGKTRLLPELLARTPKTFGRYYEPFAGGAALFFRLAPARAVLADANVDLMVTYLAVATQLPALEALLEQHAAAHALDPKGHYYRVRGAWNQPGARWEPPQRAAAFLYLNKTNFNGLWRVNSDGAYNVPLGKQKNPNIVNHEGLRAAARVLGRPGVDLRLGHYRGTTSDAETGDFVYFDPPYAPLNDSSFTAYTEGDFDADDQRALAGYACELAARGVHVMLSNSDTPFVRRLYRPEDGFRVDQVMCGRAINSNGAKRGAVAEVIVTAGPGVVPGRVDF